LKQVKCPVCGRDDKMRFEIKERGGSAIKVCCLLCIKKYCEQRIKCTIRSTSRGNCASLG
jgi:hypothetical protein